jgi:exoribonuclease-2
MLIEFLEGGNFALGVNSDQTAVGSRIEVTILGGRTISVQPNRVLVTSLEKAPASDQINDFLTRIGERRNAMAEEVDLPGLWESLEGEGEQFDYELLAGLFFGRQTQGDEVSAVIRAIYRDGLWFEFSPQVAKRRSQEQIDKVRSIRDREKAKKQFKTNAAEYLALAASGRVAPEPPEGEAIKAMLKDFFLLGDEAPLANQVKEILKLASISTDGYGAFTALVALGELGRHENVDLLRSGLKLEFSPEVLSDANCLAASFIHDHGDGQTIQDAQDRLDLTHLFTITVDSPGAREFDDAMSLEDGVNGNKILWLHIADVAAVVPAGSPTDEFARGQASSIYLPDARYLMLPVNLTEEILSLKKGSTRPAFSLEVHLDSRGKILSSSFKPSLISVDLQLSFPEAEAILEQANGSQTALSPFLALAQVFLEARLAAGGQNLRLPKANVRLNPQGRPEVFLADSEPKSGMMVEEMMILANYLSAKTLSEAGYPCPFRYQAKSQPRQWEPQPDAPYRIRLASDLAARKLTGRSGLSLEASPHCGIGLSHYTSFTSPMRRYLDLMVARQLRALTLGQPPVYDSDELFIRTKNFDDDYRKIKRLQFSRNRYWLVALMAGQIGTEFVGLVFERRFKWAKICLTDIMLEFDLPFIPPEIGPGRDVLLRLTAASPKVADRKEVLSFDYLGPA